LLPSPKTAGHKQLQRTGLPQKINEYVTTALMFFIDGEGFLSVYPDNIPEKMVLAFG